MIALSDNETVSRTQIIVLLKDIAFKSNGYFQTNSWKDNLTIEYAIKVIASTTA